MSPLSSPTHKPRLRPAPEAPSASLALKRLFWLYFLLLILEGALRKWFLPQFSTPLLIVRDPVALAIYLVAIRDHLLPKGRLVNALSLFAVMSLVLCLLQIIFLEVPIKVLLYGLRTNLLHLPLLFLAPLIFDLRDLQRLGKCVLLLSIPMALLMAWQFNSPPDAWINRAPGSSGGSQLLAALGKVRPPGSFSFSTGPVSFFALATAFLLYGIKGHRQAWPRWLLIAGCMSVVLAGAVSGSRSLILSVAIVIGVWLLGLVAARQTQVGVPRLLLLLAISFSILIQIKIFQEGTEVLATRWEMAASAERAEGGMIGRLLRSLLSPISLPDSIPLLGHGLGVGTNVGASLMTGKSQFLLAEEEWARLTLEMGPVVGAAFILFRIALTLSLANLSLRAAAGGTTLPLLLFGAGAAYLLTGQIAQPTILGFTVLTAGLCLTAITHSPAPEPSPQPTRRSNRKQRPDPRHKQRNNLPLNP